MVQTLLDHSFLPSQFWVEAASTSIYIQNRLPTSVLKNQIPYTILFSKKPDYTYFKTFGCVCYVHLPPQERTKFTKQATKCIFVGYSPTQKGYQCYDPELKRIRVSRHVIFMENNFDYPQTTENTPHSPRFLFTDFPESVAEPTPSTPTTSLSPNSSQTVTTSPIPQQSSFPPTPPSIVVPHGASPGMENPTTRKSTRLTKASVRFGDWQFFCTFDANRIPTSFKEACAHSHWRTAINE